MMSPRSFLVTRQNQPSTSSTGSLQRPSVTSTPLSLFSPSSQLSKPARENDERSPKPTEHVSNNSTNIDTSAMAAFKRRRESDSKSPSPSPPRTTTTISRPTTPSSPVQIPVKSKAHETAHPQRQHRHHGHSDRRRQSSTHRPRDVHTPDAIPPSVAALLAITSIPPPKSSRNVRKTSIGREKRMTVDSIIERSQESEKQLSLTLSKGPLDLLLTPPEDLESDDISFCESNIGSALSTRTVSLESMPSLSESYTTDTFSSLGSPRTPSRRRKAQPTRRSLEPVSSPPGEVEEHPLSSPIIAVDELDFRVFENEPELETQKASRLPFKPLKSAFKSNLTASLRALRQAARSLSSLNLTSIPPEDFLTRSILTLDPQVPFTDERRPPPLEEEPTAALRRYLNPTTTARLEQPLAATPNPAVKSFTASIQMQTYKIHRARSTSTGSGRVPQPQASPPSPSQAPQGSQQRPVTAEYPMPGPRQREMRENPDFIRIAVMEMAMRRQGKLDDQRPGRARWALPPRKTSAKAYVIGDDGIPARWIAITCE
ncbi:hypothetical protein QBC37DRAFT_24481 [Rhypophila decipiens]|uniref:Uncharacterized protein n=1 Tax=Rhypophila decipiens TaxID=261697 RepID=A0AAN6YFW7_9PEZI|nr:hypothetical protein QBC37DRAFT_24481 [Rhypophila decipiens]